MRTRTRTILVLTALAGTVALVVVDTVRDERPAQGPAILSSEIRGAGVAAGEPSGSQAAGGESNTLALPARAPLGEGRAGLFSSRSWQPSAPPAAKNPIAVQAPTAPPVPYKYAGRVVREDRLSVLLSKGNTVFPITEGETLDGAWRVDSIDETRITLVYLPLGLKERIAVESSLPVAASARRTGPAAAADGGRTASATAVPARDTNPAGTATAPGSPAAGPAASGLPGTKSGQAHLLWHGPQQVKLGTRFEVALRLTSDQPLHASPMQLRYDPAYLEFVTARPGKFLGGGDRNFNYRVNPDGSIFVGASVQRPVSASDAELLILTFKPVKPSAAAELNISSLNLQGAAGRPIAFSQLTAFKTKISP